MYFQWANGSYTSVDGAVSVKYLFSPGEASPFPDDFRMLAGSPSSRSKNESGFSSDEAFLCLNPLAQPSRHDKFPSHQCLGGLWSQVVRITLPHPSTETNSHLIDVPELLGWEGVIPFCRVWTFADLSSIQNLDSDDHESHVAFATDGKCTNPAYPVTLPQIQVEVRWDTAEFYSLAKHALNPKQPFVLSNGDATGYSFYAAFLNGWETKVLQRAVDKCTCGMYGDMKCCADAGIFTIDTTSQCRITPHIMEQGEFHLLPPSVRGLDPSSSSFYSARHT